ncbi:MAG: DUF2933 domain-containing protein [Pseudomonadota bacterium]
MSIHDHSHSESETPHGSFLTTRAGLAFVGFAIIVGALLFTEHRAHVFGVLIWLPLLACPFMHLFMHHGQGGHGGHGGHVGHERQSQKIDEGKAP